MGSGGGNGMMFGLIRLDQGNQYIQLVAFWRIGFVPPQCLDLSQGGIIVLLGFDGSNFHCLVLSVALQHEFVVLGMGADNFHEHSLAYIVHINYQPVLVSRDIEYNQRVGNEDVLARVRKERAEVVQMISEQHPDVLAGDADTGVEHPATPDKSPSESINQAETDKLASVSQPASYEPQQPKRGTDETQGAMFSRSTPESPPTPLGFDIVEQTAQALARKSGLPGGVRIHVKETEQALPAKILEQAKKEGALGEIIAVHIGRDIYLVADRHFNIAQIEESILHEGSHYGGWQLFGSERNKAYTRLWMKLGGAKGVASWAEKAGFSMAGYIKTADRLVQDGKMTAAERSVYLVDEFLAGAQGRTAYEKLPERILRAVREFWGAIRSLLRTKGFMELAEFSDSDLAYLLRNIRKAAQGASKETDKARAAFMVAWDREGYSSDNVPQDGGRDGDAKLFAPDAAESERFKADLGKWFDAPAAVKPSGSPLVVGRTPAIMQAFGVPDHEIQITKSTLLKVTRKEHGKSEKAHGLGFDMVS